MPDLRHVPSFSVLLLATHVLVTNDVFAVLRGAEEVHRSVEEALAAQEAARRAMAGGPSPPATADAGVGESQRPKEVRHADEDAEADSEQPNGQPAAAAAGHEPDRPHVGLAEVTELPEVSRVCTLAKLLTLSSLHRSRSKSGVKGLRRLVTRPACALSRLSCSPREGGVFTPALVACTCVATVAVFGRFRARSRRCRS